MRGRSKPVPGSNVRVTFHSGLELLHEGETIGYAPTLHDLSIQDPQNVDPLDAHLPIGHAHPRNGPRWVPRATQRTATLSPASTAETIATAMSGKPVLTPRISSSNPARPGDWPARAAWLSRSEVASSQALSKFPLLMTSSTKAWTIALFGGWEPRN